MPVLSSKPALRFACDGGGRILQRAPRVKAANVPPWSAVVGARSDPWCVDPVVGRFGESPLRRRRFRRRTAAATRRIVAHRCASGSDAASRKSNVGSSLDRRLPLAKAATVVFNRVTHVSSIVHGRPGLQSLRITGNYATKAKGRRQALLRLANEVADESL
ncbi:hypothetical protein MRX96_003937 [Rhipicephalus microplus]